MLRDDDQENDLELSNSILNDHSSFINSMIHEPVNYNILNFMYTNARSLPPKIRSLIDMFDNLDLHFAAISETWMTSGKKFQRNARKLEDKEDLIIIERNRRTRGGGVAIVFNKHKMILKPLKIPNNVFELVGAVGRTNDNSRKVVIYSVYYPPQLKREKVEALNACISASIDRQKVLLDYPRFIICGDFNLKNYLPIITDHPDITVMDSPNTRKNEILDLCLANFETGATITKFPPLDNDKGQLSDHHCMVVQLKEKRVHLFKKKRFSFRPYNLESAEYFGAQLLGVEWSPIHLMDVNEAVDFLDSTLISIYESSFPLKTKTVKSSDEPWVNNKVRKLSEKKRKYYQIHGKNATWKKIVQDTDVAVSEAKSAFLTKVKANVTESKNTGSFFKAVKLLQSKNAPAVWNVRNLFPQASDTEIANDCVKYFSAISREYQPISDPKTTPAATWSIPLHEVSSRLKYCKKPKSMVRGDLAPQLVTRFHDLIAIPLHCIYNKIISTNSWPDLWKHETVKVIPKKTIPESIKDLRNISCTPLFSKVMEYFLLKKLGEKMSLSRNQFGGIKGSGIDHFLSETWHELLMNLEDPDAAANLVSIDFSKAFNRMDHGACVRALEEAGVDLSVVSVVKAFLFNRKMSVHINGEVSQVMSAPGGSPQGSVLGGFLFCATTDKLSSNLDANGTLPFDENGVTTSDNNDSTTNISLSPIAPPPREMPMWHDVEMISDSDDSIDLGIRGPRQRLLDTTMESLRPSQSALEDFLQLDDWHRPPASVKAYIDDFNVIEKVRTTAAISHITAGKTTYSVHAPQSENIFITVGEKAQELGMVVNESKTQLLCISAKGPQLQSYIRTETGQTIDSADHLKILGFTFGQTPDVSVNTCLLTAKFNSSLWALRKLKRSGMSQPDLLFCYKTTIRPIIDFACVTYHSLLSKEQSLAIEHLQLRAMKVIYGEHVSYRTVIESGKIELLEDRRNDLRKKFALKTSKNPRYSDWFPLNADIEHDLRRREKYHIPRLRTERAKKSPIIQMRRLLNEIAFSS